MQVIILLYIALCSVDYYFNIVLNAEHYGFASQLTGTSFMDLIVTGFEQGTSARIGDILSKSSYYYTDQTPGPLFLRQNVLPCHLANSYARFFFILAYICNRFVSSKFLVSLYIIIS